MLQSYRDTDGGLESRYATYARKFAPVVHGLGAKPVLYATSPKTQNSKALADAPDPKPAIEDTTFLLGAAAALSESVEALAQGAAEPAVEAGM